MKNRVKEEYYWLTIDRNKKEVVVITSGDYFKFKYGKQFILHTHSDDHE